MLKLYEEGALKNTCKVLDYNNGYIYVLERRPNCTGGYHDFSSPYLAIYDFVFQRPNEIKKVSSSSMGLVTDVTDIFNTPSDSTDWGTSEMIDKFKNLYSAILSNNFFSAQDEETQQPLPVKVFFKTVAGEFADETQYDFYKYLDFLKYEHHRIITKHISSTSTQYSFEVLLRETKDIDKADALETFTDASELSVTCESGRIRQGSNIATLTVGCSASDDSQAAEERIIFSTGPSVEGITVTGVSWANGDTPSFKANKVYEISVSYIPLLGKFLATYAEY